MSKDLTTSQIRNVAIIAHIDHGKTTLLDGLLKQSHIFLPHEQLPDRIMDTYDQERERGITIFSKHTSLYFHDYKINIIDTPGHADFLGEVEKILGMVNSVILIVDAQEGPMPQTRFVLSKALKMGLCPIVVFNKIDRPHANPDRALNLTFDLFVELNANDEQLNFPYCYASGLSGFAMKNLDDEREDMDPLFNMIVEHVPPPAGDINKPFLMQAATITYNDFLGRQAGGRILNGKVEQNQEICFVTKDGKERKTKITKIEGRLGLRKVELEEAIVGDIVYISGFPEVNIGDTLCSPDEVVKMPPVHIDEPTMSIEIMANSGPFSGKDGKHVNMNKIRDRLRQEKNSNVSLKIDESDPEKIVVTGRGEMQLAVLLEAMRREDYEITISSPEVVKKEIDGVKHEPIDRVHIEVPEEYSGSIIEELSQRKGEMQSLSTNEHNITSMEFLIPVRGLLNFRNEFLTMTRGLGILTAIFETFAPWKGDIQSRKRGVLVSICPGKTNPYACFNLQARGSLFMRPGDEVYEGMIVGEHCRDNDLVVNVTKGKQLTNVRASGTDENIILTPPREFNLERAISYIQSDELLEITPHNIRLRKRFLKESERKRSK